MRAILNRQDLSESPTEALTGVSDLKRQIMSLVLRPPAGSEACCSEVTHPPCIRDVEDAKSLDIP